MCYTWATLWHERRRFIPAVFAVAFSSLLVASQSGLLLGTLAVVSLPIDRSTADVWVGTPEVTTVDAGLPIPERWAARFNLPEVDSFEVYIRGGGSWQKPDKGTEKCIILGSRLHSSALGAVRELTPELRMRLSEPGAVVVDQDDLGRLGLKRGTDEVAEVRGQRVQVVGVVRGFRGLGSAHVFCSIETARRLLRLPDGQATYLLGRCRDPERAASVVDGLRRYADMSVFTGPEFSMRSRMHWLSKTGAGVALGLAAALGLLVGAVVTSQTLYAATVVSLREYAVLQAMGIPRWRMTVAVMLQSFWVGIGGVTLALPATFGVAHIAETLGANVLLTAWLLSATGILTLLMALFSGTVALRSVRLVEPALLLR